MVLVHIFSILLDSFPLKLHLQLEYHLCTNRLTRNFVINQMTIFVVLLATPVRTNTFHLLFSQCLSSKSVQLICCKSEQLLRGFPDKVACLPEMCSHMHSSQTCRLQHDKVSGSNQRTRNVSCLNSSYLRGLRIPENVSRDDAEATSLEWGPREMKEKERKAIRG